MSSADFFETRVIWNDTTKYGTTLSGRLEQTIRNTLHSGTFDRLRRLRSRHAGRPRLASGEIVEAILEERAAPTYQAAINDQDFWHIDRNAVQPSACLIRTSDHSTFASIPLDPQSLRNLRAGLRSNNAVVPPLGRLLQRQDGILRNANFARRIQRSPRLQPLFVGHACVSWTDGDVRVWTDPFLRPKSLAYPATYQPLGPLDMPEAIHVVAITHSHPDHFDPGSLLLFPEDTQFLIPMVERETPLTLDLSHRLRQLGFDNVRQMRWGESYSVGRFEIVALPFHGEQPLGGHAIAERDDRMVGNIYLVKPAGGPSCLLLADSGSDPWGSAVGVARHVRRDHGRVDFLFGNHRRWRLFPPQYLISSVPHYLCYIPDAELQVPQQIMLDADGLWSIADIIGAKRVVPYAMGGARWYAELGLGPDPMMETSSSAFYAGLDELERTDDEDTVITSSARPLKLAAGQGATGLARKWWATGVSKPGARQFGKTKPTSAPRTFAAGGVVMTSVLPHLSEVTKLDPRAWLVADGDFCEIVCASDAQADFLWTMVGRLQPPGSWYTRSEVPISAGQFADHRNWLGIFEDLHRQSFLVLRDSDAPIARWRQIFTGYPFQSLPSELVAMIAQGLLKLPLSIRGRIGTGGRDETFAITHSDVSLPDQAESLLKTYSRVEIALALLLVRLVHNTYRSVSAIRTSVAVGDEYSFFVSMLSSET
ncbi:MBL fold metallo-hydrolase [Mesorhizobium sp. M4B.F.Ca.ET.203.01.1.1]|uniref:MBL fold metallo-hydrolase n=1 Tax=unclassified Mesorhizobium TaxID=325217 RepID=UPI0026B0EC94